MPPRIAKLAGLGAFGACGGIVAVFALFVYGTSGSGSPGLDAPERFLAQFAVGGVLLALLGVHLVLARRLLALSRGVPERA